MSDKSIKTIRELKRDAEESIKNILVDLGENTGLLITGVKVDIFIHKSGLGKPSYDLKIDRFIVGGVKISMEEI